MTAETIVESTTYSVEVLEKEKEQLLGRVAEIDDSLEIIRRYQHWKKTQSNGDDPDTEPNTADLSHGRLADAPPRPARKPKTKKARQRSKVNRENLSNKIQIIAESPDFAGPWVVSALVKRLVRNFGPEYGKLSSRMLNGTLAHLTEMGRLKIVNKEPFGRANPRQFCLVKVTS